MAVDTLDDQRYGDPAGQLSTTLLQPMESSQGPVESVPRSRQMAFTTYDSRDSTPDPEYRRAWGEKDVDFYGNGDTTIEPDVCQGAAGRLPEEVYERTLTWWRNGIRKMLLRNVEWESDVIAAMQERVRHPILDAYFVYTSSLGTHTFFMITLPALIFFGYQDVARGLIMVLALGVYASSFVKDLFCSPRPFAPPVTRLTMGSHHLEYGFPSTHSTNSVSIALYCFSLLRQLSTTPLVAAGSISAALVDSVNITAVENATANVLDLADAQEMMISSTTYHTVVGILLFYTFSIVYGRLYTGMHSLTDCVMGILLGAGVWAAHLVCSEPLHAWIRDGGWVVPAVMVPLCLLLVHRHPQPVDDCPCFEDAIAFVSVVMGEVLSRWYMQHSGYDQTFFVSEMPGRSWATWMDVATWWSIGALKLVLGILIIFAWRIFAKSLSHMVLPPIFRLLAQLFTLPHRRFYTPATDYTNVPPEKGLHPIPSLIDLPGMLEREDEGASTAHRGHLGGGAGAGGMKLRTGKGRLERAAGASTEKEKVGLWLEEVAGEQEEVVV
ncbi:PAP2-domain-containing protein, partial [Amylocystis lapponica]